MELQIPSIVAAFLAAERSNDAHTLAACFSEDGIVHDEARSHRGHSAIQQWKEDADGRYSYTSEPLVASTEGATVTIRTRVEGSFPGSLVELSQVFTVADGKIVSLEIRA